MSWHTKKTRTWWRQCHSALPCVCYPFCVHACSLYQPQWDSLICMRLMLTRLSKCHSLCACVSQARADPNTRWLEPWGWDSVLVRNESTVVQVDRGLATRGQHLFRCVSNLKPQCRRDGWQQKTPQLWVLLESLGYFHSGQSSVRFICSEGKCMPCNTLSTVRLETTCYFPDIIRSTTSEKRKLPTTSVK